MLELTINDLILIGAHFNPVPLKNARVFITGAGSWFGQWLTTFLDYSGIEWERYMKPYDRFPSGAFDYIIHLAQCPIQPVLEFAHRAQVSTFLFVSSGSLFNPDPDVKSDKVAHEKAVRESGLDYRIARCYTAIGAGSPLRYAAASFLKQASRHEPLNVLNAGSSIRTYIYMADLVAWLMTILYYGNKEIYDVAGKEPVSILDLAHMINKITGNMGINVMGQNHDIRPIYLPDKTNLHHSLDLGLDVWTGLPEAIKRTWEYYR